MVIRHQSPAPIEDCLDIMGGRRRGRQVMLYQQQACDSAAFYDEAGDLLAIAFITRPVDGRRELALAILPRARARMRELCRIAQLTLAAMAETESIICHIAPQNRAGARMARIVGFSPDPEHQFRWVMEQRNASTLRPVRREQRSGKGREGTAPAAGGGE